MWGQVVIALFKLLISGTILIYLISGADFGKFTQTLITLEIIPLIIAVLAYAAIPFIQTLRWQSALKIFSRDLKFSQSVSFTFTGIFFSNFLPSIGGDVVKAALTGMHIKNSWLIVSVSVFLEKFFGLIGILALLLISFAFWQERPPNLFDGSTISHTINWPNTTLLIIAFIISLGLIVLFQKRRLTSLLQKLLPFARVVIAARVFSMPMIVLIGAGIFTQVFQTISYFFVAVSLGMEIEPTALIFFAQLVTVAIYLPISFGGWGIRELLLVSNAALLGSNPDDLLLLGIISGTIPLIISLPGVYFWQKTKISMPDQKTFRISDLWKKNPFESN